VSSQVWLKSPAFDLTWILSPAFFASLGVVLFRSDAAAVSPFVWLVFILGIDVAHVYATLYRTYWNPEERLSYQTALWVIPVASWLAGTLLYGVSPLLFWRGLAYLAAFHFVRQQYGFFCIYAGRNGENVTWLDKAALYLAMVFPLVYWHTHPRNFEWFVPGDFFFLPFAFLTPFTLLIWATAWIAYGWKELKRGGVFNWPKNLILLGTALSWNVGIVLLNSDLAFTVTNVVSHGVPYLALLWWYGQSYASRNREKVFWRGITWKRLFTGFGCFFYLGSLLVLAYLEEGLWDGLVWRERGNIFPWFSGLPHIQLKGTLAWLVPLLTLPQVTHYLIDGFIWRVSGPSASFNFLEREPT